MVTQNRILTELEGYPTTFDFKGLTIDAGLHYRFTSRKGEYTEHEEDMHLLYGEELSYNEARIFEDIAGLPSISTVQGLQYAHANPGEYTVHTIISANESTIDALELSENTKSAMRADVAEGYTITTPNKLVTSGTWSGLFYISHRQNPPSTKYAIGEQVVSNGGFTEAELSIASYNDENNITRIGKLYSPASSEKEFYYEDVPEQVGGVRCYADKDWVSLIMARADWVNAYGHPCAEGQKTFGNVTHEYVIASRFTHFYSPGKYNYWISIGNVKSQLAWDKNNDSKVQDVQLNGPFEFDFTVGTYAWEGKYTITGVFKGDLIEYYQPDSDNIGHGRVVYGEILAKLKQAHYASETIFCPLGVTDCSKQNWVFEKLGFPIGEKTSTLESFAGTTGSVQKFIGGVIYIKQGIWLWAKNTYYVPEKLSEYHVSTGGSGGQFGFPKNDPNYLPETDEYIQKFEWKMVQYFPQTDTFNTIAYSNNERRLNNKEYVKKILDMVMDGDITDAEAFARISDYIAYVNDSDSDYVKDLTIVLVGVEKILTITQYRQVQQELASLEQNYYQWGNNYKSGEVFSDTGFKFEHNDSHYIQRCRGSANQHNYNSNQLFHSMLGLNVGYFWAAGIADFATIIHDVKVNVFGLGASLEDINLGFKMGSIGNRLKMGLLSRNIVGNAVRSEIMDEINSPARSKKVLETECNVRKNFRIFEMETFAESGKIEAFVNLHYSQDMMLGTDMKYYQYYERFGSKSNVSAYWDDAQQKVVLITN